MPAWNVIEWTGLAEDARRRCLERPTRCDAARLRHEVTEIIAGVRARGDEAVAEFSRRFDGLAPVPAEIPRRRLTEAFEAIDGEVRAALELAARQIETFHVAQVPAAIEVETGPGVLCQRRWVPLDRVGLYVPGGTAPLVSTVLMLAIPARVARVRERILCTPPQPGGLSPAILAAAHLAGVDRVFAIGGAQAIAAMAYGTETVPSVDKLFGPGNSYVTTAKQLCSLDADGADLDLPAGPSELLVIADADANPSFVAADLLSQAEHGKDSQVLLVSTSAALLAAVQTQLDAQLATLPRRAIAAASLEHARFIVAADTAEALTISNRYGPEHLILQVGDPEGVADGVCVAGSVFVGPLSPESAGDYASGTNHVLPTDGWAASRGGLAVESFMRAITLQRLTEQGVMHLAPTVECLAGLEGLDAHGRAMAMRREAVEARRRGESA